MGADEETAKTHVRPRCFMDVAVDNILLGRIVYELFDDFCPLTCENFRALCTGEKGLGKNTGKPLHYQGVIFHRVVKSFMVQCGDFSAGNGTGGESIFGGTFPDENFDLKHDQPFLLSMANRGPDTNSSQFFITTQSSPHLDGIHVVFGRVVSGQSVVMQIEELGVDNNSRPLQDAKVVKCGELVLKSKIKESEESSTDGELSSESDDEKKRKQKKRAKESKRKSEKLDDIQVENNDNAELDGQLHPLVSVTNIDPEEIPAGPPNRFLSRGGPSSMFLLKPQNDSDEKPKKINRIRGVTKSGRIVKGRGTLRFRTPSRSRSRSYTPPHWRQEQKKMISFNEFEKMEMERKVKEEEIKRREEARKKRHEEKEKHDKGKEGDTPPGTPPKGSNKHNVKAEIDMMAKIEDVFQIIRDRNLKNGSENRLNNKKSENRYFDVKKKDNRSYDNKKSDRSYENKKSDRSYDDKKLDQSQDTKKSDRPQDTKKTDRSQDHKKSDRSQNKKTSDRSQDGKKSIRSLDNKKSGQPQDNEKPDRSYDGKKSDQLYDSKKNDRSFDNKKKARSYDNKKKDRSYDSKKDDRSYDNKKDDQSYDSKKLDRTYDNKKLGHSYDIKKKSRSNDKEKLQKVEKKIDAQSRSRSPKRQSASRTRKDEKTQKDRSKHRRDEKTNNKFTQEEKRNRSRDKEHFGKKKKYSRRSSSSSSGDRKNKKKFKNGNSFSLSPEVKD